jgi:hypothetical protein
MKVVLLFLFLLGASCQQKPVAQAVNEPVLPADLPDWFYQYWYELVELENSHVAVYHPESYDFTPRRFRPYLRFSEGDSLSYFVIGADDSHVPVPHRWQRDGDTIKISGPELTAVWLVKLADKEELKVELIEQSTRY